MEKTIPCNIFSVAASWRAVQDVLPYHRTIAIDLPGVGKAEQPEGFDFSLTNNAEVLISLMDKMKIKQADILGHARGASIGLILAMKYPERVRTLLMNAPVLYDYWPVIEVLAMGSLKEHMDDVRKMMPILQPMISSLLTLLVRIGVYRDGVMTNEALRRNIGHFLSPQGVENLISICAAGHTEEVNGLNIKQLEVPALIVWGDRDNYFDPSCGERFYKEAPDCEYYVIPESGLLTLDEAPAELGRAIDRFMIKRGYRQE